MAGAPESDELACELDAAADELDALFDALGVICLVVEHPVTVTATIVVANTSFLNIQTSS